MTSSAPERIECATTGHGSDVAPSCSSSASSSSTTRSAAWMAWMICRSGSGGAEAREVLDAAAAVVDPPVLDRHREQVHEALAAAVPAGRVEPRLGGQAAGEILGEHPGRGGGWRRDLRAHVARDISQCALVIVLVDSPTEAVTAGP